MNSLYGALVGDAAGATLEFYTEGPLTEEVVQRAMRMPGGGSLRVGPGQITDDGELTLTLLRSLSATDDHASERNRVDEIIRGYAAWYESMPFDIGRTCSLAFDELASLGDPSMYSLQEIETTIAEWNQTSEANGALMRASAIATWGALHHVPFESVLRLAKQDARLSHPSTVCQEVNAVYVFAVCRLLCGIPPPMVLQETAAYVDQQVTSERVKHWFHHESLDIQGLIVTEQCGHVRWAFVMAFYFLRHPEIRFEEAIAQVLLKGGDTDTNAAIVGGMVGAYQSVPVWMLGPVMGFDATTCTGRHGRRRPRAYCPKYVLSE